MHRGIIAYVKQQGSKRLVGCMLPCFVAKRLWLELVLQCELKLTLSLRVVDEAEGWTDAGVRGHQDRVVESVDGFGTELQTLALNDTEVFGDAEINSLQTGATEAADLAVAEGPKAGLRYGA
jgi:hypothetical protein